MVVNNSYFLINLNLTILDLTYTDTSNEFVVINSRYKHLCISIRITLWCWYIIVS